MSGVARFFDGATAVADPPVRESVPTPTTPDGIDSAMRRLAHLEDEREGFLVHMRALHQRNSLLQQRLDDLNAAIARREAATMEGQPMSIEHFYDKPRRPIAPAPVAPPAPALQVKKATPSARSRSKKADEWLRAIEASFGGQEFTAMQLAAKVGGRMQVARDWLNDRGAEHGVEAVGTRMVNARGRPSTMYRRKAKQ